MFIRQPLEKGGIVLLPSVGKEPIQILASGWRYFLCT